MERMMQNLFNTLKDKAHYRDFKCTIKERNNEASSNLPFPYMLGQNLWKDKLLGLE